MSDEVRILLASIFVQSEKNLNLELNNSQQPLAATDRMPHN